ncbi:hypothetical protein RGU70_14260 [Herbaspirillum sp. RTI4]|uniref:hypothetical protein n=1 Tax=Herbaspirillum sp. RTI4 TaxID=3048640 RepID=UPI002AB3BD58|nr:hypothetical protein [Herbaspirillum sp. RTI4]MDY7579478.1 hypothetical protein [Herbaspirillum sp. RTI4]MEA9980392.1 hypothetical protein [Herbaspirillum sp. RTI4]
MPIYLPTKTFAQNKILSENKIESDPRRLNNRSFASLRRLTGAANVGHSSPAITIVANNPELDEPPHETSSRISQFSSWFRQVRQWSSTPYTHLRESGRSSIRSADQMTLHTIREDATPDSNDKLLPLPSPAVAHRGIHDSQLHLLDIDTSALDQHPILNPAPVWEATAPSPSPSPSPSQSRHIAAYPPCPTLHPTSQRTPPSPRTPQTSQTRTGQALDERIPPHFFVNVIVLPPPAPVPKHPWST